MDSNALITRKRQKNLLRFAYISYIVVRKKTMSFLRVQPIFYQ